MYEKILVPLDGSATAETVLPYVEALAAGFKCSVELISALDIGSMATHLSAQRVRQLDAIIATEEKKCAAYLTEVAEKYELKGATTQVVRGAPEDVILDSASQNRATLIAMATHGRSGVKRWLLGSVAEKILRGTTNPLFLVRADVARSEPLRIINSLVVPLDGSPLAEKILPTVIGWAKALNLEVTLVRAFEFVGAAQLGAEAYIPNQEQFEADARNEIAGYLREQERALVSAGVRTVSAVTLKGPAADEIVSFAHDAPRAVIAMSTHGRTGARRWMLGSVTEKVVRHGDDPVLVVRGEER